MIKSFIIFLISTVLFISTVAADSPPTVPVPVSPIDSVVIDEIQPVFYIYNSTDPDMDQFWYDFKVYDKDSMMDGPVFGLMIDPQEDSTGWQTPYPLVDNWILFWRARACDSLQNCSEWSEEQVFWINTAEDEPWPFNVNYPPDTGGTIIIDPLTNFYWARAIEPDPYDSVYYTLYISADSEFQSPIAYDSIWETEYILTDSLDFGTRYWWQAKATDNAGNFSMSNNTPDFWTWMLGDADGSHQINIMDCTFLIDYLYRDGRQPYPLVMGDIDGDCAINIMDVVYLIDYLYRGGPAPLIGCAER